MWANETLPKRRNVTYMLQPRMVRFQRKYQYEIRVLFCGSTRWYKLDIELPGIGQPTLLRTYTRPGNNPPSAMPKNRRVSTKPAKVLINAVLIATSPKAIIKNASHIEPKCFNAKLDGISTRIY